MDLLLQRGGEKVAGFDLEPSSFETRVKVYQNDIADPDTVVKALRGCRYL